MMRIFNRHIAPWFVAAAATLVATPAAADLMLPDAWLGPVCEGRSSEHVELPRENTRARIFQVLTEADPLSGAFGARLLGSIAGDGDGNALVSPLGVGAVLAMLSEGAKKSVRAAVDDVLGVGAVEGEASESGSPPPEGDSALSLACQSAALWNAAVLDGDVDVDVASAVFAERGLDVFPSYSTALSKKFRAPVERLDFGDAGAVDRINAWVSESTFGAIPKLISKLDPNDVLVLANAMRFHGKWAQPFDPQRTGPAPFSLRSGDAVEVPTMHAEELEARYREDEGAQAVALPYGKGDFELVVVLPSAGTGRAEALERLASDAGWLGAEGFRSALGSLAMPRLSLGTEASLLGALRALGLEETLADEQAFAGIAAPAPMLSQVLQRTMLELDESGTEAAAATAAVMTKRSVMQPVPFEMRVDRPFALAVRYRPTGAVLFAAWVEDPSKG